MGIVRHGPEGAPSNEIRKESKRRSLQGRVVRAETRGREFVSVVRLTCFHKVAGAKAISPQLFFMDSEGQGMKVPEITGTRPEARRSNPG